MLRSTNDGAAERPYRVLAAQNLARQQLLSKG